MNFFSRFFTRAIFPCVCQERFVLTAFDRKAEFLWVVLSVELVALMISDIVNVLSQSTGRSLFVNAFAIWCTSLSTPHHP